MSKALRADRNLAPDLAEANDADGRTVQRAGAAEADEIAARRVAAVERPVGALFGLDALDGDEAVEFVELARQHQHQPEGVLGAGDVGAAAQRQKLDALLGAGGGVDVAKPRAEFLQHLEPGRRGEIVAADAKRLDHQRRRSPCRLARISSSDVTSRTSAG